MSCAYMAAHIHVQPIVFPSLTTRLPDCSAHSQNGRTEYAWMTRHVDPLVCGVGAVAMWLVYRFHLLAMVALH